MPGCIVTIDAMECQRDIAVTIIDAGADYILAAKNNQQELYQTIKDTFRFKFFQDVTVCKDLDFRHRRIETRTCWYVGICCWSIRINGRISGRWSKLFRTGIINLQERKKVHQPGIIYQAWSRERSLWETRKWPTGG